MPAKSKSQQRFFGMIRAIQKGELEPPSKEMSETAKKMKKKDVLEFAETKHDKPKKLPEKVTPKKEKKKKKTKKKSELILDLVKLSNLLDDHGLYEDADMVDSISNYLMKE